MIHKYKNTLTTLFLTIILAPSVYAYTGISPLDSVFTIIGSFFSFDALQNERTAIGVARFAWFIIIFALLAYAGRMVFGAGGSDALNKKTAHIIAFTLAAISTLFLPTNILMAATGGYTAFIWSAIMLVPAIAAIYFAFGTASAKSADASTGQRLIELTILILGFVFTTMMLGNMLPWIQGEFPSVSQTVSTVVAWATMIMLALIVWKLFQLFGATGGGSDYSYDDKGRRRRKRRGGEGDDDPDEGWSNQRKPGPVVGFRGEHQENKIALWWVENPEQEEVRHYEVQRIKLRRGNIRWKRLPSANQAPNRENPYVDNTIDKELIKLVEQGSYKYRVRAINAAGRSRWVFCSPGKPTRDWRPVIVSVQNNPERRTIDLQGKVE